MSYSKESDSGTFDIYTSAPTLVASYTASAEELIDVQLMLSNLSTSVGTLILSYVVNDGSNDFDGYEYAIRRSDSSRFCTDRLFFLRLESGWVLKVYAESTNSGDTSVVVTTDFISTAAANTVLLGGDSGAVSDLDSMVTDYGNVALRIDNIAGQSLAVSTGQGFLSLMNYYNSNSRVQADVTYVAGSVVAGVDDFKADVSSLAVDIKSVAGNSVSGVDDFKANVSNLTVDVVSVAGSVVTGVDEFKADITDLEADVNTLLTRVTDETVYLAPSVTANSGNRLTLNQGEAYLNTLSNALSWTIKDTRFPSTLDDSDGVRAFLRLDDGKGTILSKEGSLSSFDSATSTATFEFELTAAQTSSLAAGQGTYEIDVWIGSVEESNITFFSETTMTVKRQIRSA